MILLQLCSFCLPFSFSLAVEKIPCEEKEDKDISKLVSGIVKCSINRQISYKTVGPNEVSPLCLFLASASKSSSCLPRTSRTGWESACARARLMKSLE